MNKAREALQIIEFQIKAAADTDPALRAAATTIAAALDERDALVRALDNLRIHTQWLRENHHDLLPSDYKEESMEEQQARAALVAVREEVIT